MMKKFGIKMFDVNSKVRTITVLAVDTEDTLEMIGDAFDRDNGLFVGVDKRVINLSNIVEIVSIEEVKE